MPLRFLRGLVSSGPPAFSFNPVTNAAISTLETSNTITLGSFVGTAAITVSGGQYSKNGGAYTSSLGTAVSGDTISLQQTSSGSNSTETDTVFTAGTTSATWRVTTVSSGSVPLLTPTGAWNGTPGSAYVGMTGNVPAQDPTRITAKPSLRMASAWGARISGSTYRIYVDAECAGLNTGTSFGIATLNGYLEGGSGAATFGKQTYTDPNGNSVSVQCYAFDIDVASCVAAHGSGGVDFYAEAIPLDTNMQKRVIGPFRFYPRATQYSRQYDVGVGQTYATRKQAIAAIVAANEEAPLILYHTTASYEAEDCSAFGAYAGLKGFITEKAATGVTATINRSVFPTGLTESAAFWDPGPDGIEWGPGIVLDPRNWSFIVNHNQTQNDGLKHGHRLNGCQVINSEGTLDSYYWNGRPRPSGLWSAPGFVEDCTIKWLVGPISTTFVVRNVAIRGSLREVAENCYYNNKVFLNGWDAWTFWSPVNAMTIAYTGAGVGRAWITGFGIADSSAVWHLSVNGTETHTITLGAFAGDANFSTTQFAATVNGFGDGWSMTAPLVGPAMSQMAGVNINATTDGGSTPTIVGSTPANVRAVYDFHQDWWHSINQTTVTAPYTTGPVQGSILRDVNIKGETRKTYDGGTTPPFFLRLDTGAIDLSILECANTICQSGDGGSCDNIFMRGTSSGSESWTPGGMGAYSRFEANVGNLFWNSGSAITSPAFVDNFLYCEASVFTTTQAAVASGIHHGNQVVSAADYAAEKAAVQALYVSVFAGDMRAAPAGLLAATGNKRTRTTTLDGAGNTFAFPDAIGQLALAQSAVVWPV